MMVGRRDRDVGRRSWIVVGRDGDGDDGRRSEFTVGRRSEFPIDRRNLFPLTVKLTVCFLCRGRDASRRPRLVTLVSLVGGKPESITHITVLSCADQMSKIEALKPEF